MVSVRDAFSNKVVGWDSSPQASTELVCSALDYAICSRDVRDGQLIDHSDYAEVGGLSRGIVRWPVRAWFAEEFLGLIFRAVVSVRRISTSAEGDGYGYDGHTDRRGCCCGVALGWLHGVDYRSVLEDDQSAVRVRRGACVFRRVGR